MIEKGEVNHEHFEYLLNVINEEKLNRIMENEVIKIKEIGNGGQARVFLAKYKNMDVAVKAFENYDLKNFARELIILSRLNHKFIPRFYGIILEKNNISIVTQFIEGRTLNKINAAEFHYEIKLKIVMNISEAIQYVHSFGFIHRDLKPENIILDKDFNIFLIDFGIATYNDPDQKEKDLTEVKGTFYYFPPEIFENSNVVDNNVLLSYVDDKFDIWAFGCTISYIFSGYVPWTNLYNQEVCIETALMNKEFFPIPKNIKEGHIKQLIKMATEIDKDKRCNINQIISFLSQIVK